MANYNFDGIDDIDKASAQYNFDGLDDKRGVGTRILDKAVNGAKAVANTAGDVASAVLPSGESTQDFGLGTVQGATMGGADELGGAGYALFDLLQSGAHKLGLADESESQLNARMKDEGFKGDIGPSTTAEIYRKAQQDSEKQFKDAEHRSPSAYLLGNLTGGVASSVVLPGALAAGGKALAGTALGAEGLSAAAEAAEALKASKAAKMALGAGDALANNVAGKAVVDAGKYLATSGDKLAKGARAAAKMAALAAPEGAIIGELSSDHNRIGASDEEKAKNTDDAAMGAATASLLGAGASIGGDLISNYGGKAVDDIGDWVGKQVDKKGYFREIRKAKELGEAGININSEAGLHGEGKNAVLHDVIAGKPAEEVTDGIIKADRANGQRISNLVDKATADGVKMDLQPQINKYFDVLSDGMKDQRLFSEDPKVWKTVNKVLKFPEQEVTPEEARDMMSFISTNMENLKGDNTQKRLYSALNQLHDGIDGVMGQNVDGYGSALQAFSKFRRMVPETLLSKDTPVKYQTKWYGDLNDREKKLFGTVRQTIDKMNKREELGNTAKVTFNNLRKNITSMADDSGQQDALKIMLGKTDSAPVTASDVGGYLSNISDKADESSLISSMHPRRDTDSGFSKLKGTVLGHDFIANQANTYGLGKRVVKQTVDKITDVPKAVYNWSNDQWINYLGKNGHNFPMGDALMEAINNNDLKKKNAIVFSLMQQPKYRHMFNEEFSENKGE